MQKVKLFRSTMPILEIESEINRILSDDDWEVERVVNLGNMGYNYSGICPFLVVFSKYEDRNDY